MAKIKVVQMLWSPQRTEGSLTFRDAYLIDDKGRVWRDTNDVKGGRSNWVILTLPDEPVEDTKEGGQNG